MYSVIIPTIWASEFTIELLNRYSKSELVKEIILIDNKPTEDINIPKVKHIKEPENTFVNPAWNKGVELASCDRIIISNDDILFDVDEYIGYLNQMEELIDNGFIGSHCDNYEIQKSENPVIEKHNPGPKGGWGCLFAFNKRNWKPIPEEIKIWYGDNWIIGMNRNIFQLRGMSIKTKMSTSSDRMDVRVVRDNDTIEWHKLINK